MALTRTRRIAAALGGATVAATAALVAASVIGPAGATDDTQSDSGGAGSTADPGGRPSIDDLRACLEEQGVTLPELGAHHAWGDVADPLSDEERDAMRDAAEECGLHGAGAMAWGGAGAAAGLHGQAWAHGFGFFAGSDEMRACAAEAGIDMPEEPGDDRPELTDEQRDAMQACAEQERAARHDELAQCMEENGSTLPDMPEEPGDERPELTDEQRDALQACAEDLGGMAFGPGPLGFGGHHGGMAFDQGPLGLGGGRGGAWGHGMMQPCDPESHDESDDNSNDGSGDDTGTSPSTAEDAFWEA